MDSVEKRKNLRFNWTAEITGYDPDNKEPLLRGRLRNLGKSGFAFVSVDRPTRGVNYNFEMDHVPHPFSFSGRVVHLRNEGSYFVVGVRIETLPFVDKCFFNNLISSKSKKLRNGFLGYAFMGGVLVGLLSKFLMGFSNGVGLGIGLGVAFLLFLTKPF